MGSFKDPIKEEEERKQRQRDGLYGDGVSEIRKSLDSATLGEKVGSFIIWGGLILFVMWLFD